VIAALIAVLTACSAEPPTPLTADAWLAAVHRTIGPTADAVTTIAVRAGVEGPQGEFVTLVNSARDGRVSINLAGLLVAGVNADGAWHCGPEANVVVPDDATLSMVRGHDLHMMVLHPSWLTGPLLDSSRTYREDSVATLRFTDALGAPLLMHISTRDTVPVAVELVNHSGQGAREVFVEFDNWQVVSGLRLFTQATFLNGGNRYVYNYRDIVLNTVPDSAFAPRCGGPPPD
jgi:hypothetical protein